MPKIDKRIANRFPDKVPQLKRVCEKAWIGDGLRKYLLRAAPQSKPKVDGHSLAGRGSQASENPVPIQT